MSEKLRKPQAAGRFFDSDFRLPVSAIFTVQLYLQVVWAGFEVEMPSYT